MQSTEWRQSLHSPHTHTHRYASVHIPAARIYTSLLLVYVWGWSHSREKSWTLSVLLCESSVADASELRNSSVTGHMFVSHILVWIRFIVYFPYTDLLCTPISKYLNEFRTVAHAIQCNQTGPSSTTTMRPEGGFLSKINIPLNWLPGIGRRRVRFLPSGDIRVHAECKPSVKELTDNGLTNNCMRLRNLKWDQKFSI